MTREMKNPRVALFTGRKGCRVSKPKPSTKSDTESLLGNIAGKRANLEIPVGDEEVA